MEGSHARSKATSFAVLTASAVLVAAVLAAWRIWQAGKRRRRIVSKNNTTSSASVFLLTTKVLDLRDEASFEKAHIRGSHNIPVAALWDDNRWYELPEQHEPLVVLIPEEGLPGKNMNSNSLAEEIRGRRAVGATATLVFDQTLLTTAKESGLLIENAWKRESHLDNVLGTSSSPPESTLFTPSPFLMRAAAVIEPHLKHAWLPLTCIDIGCGAGRDAVWLAKRGWTVTAMDCWNQALEKAVRLARRNGVSDRVQVVRGKVKHTGEIHLSTPVDEACDAACNQAVDGQGRTMEEGEDGGGAAVFSRSDASVVGAAAAWLGEDERIVRPSTPASEYGAYGLVVAIRFLERSAFDTLARLVDPRGGYILLSTFIEEDRETVARATGTARGGREGGDGGEGGGVGGKGELLPRRAHVSACFGGRSDGGEQGGVREGIAFSGDGITQDGRVRAAVTQTTTPDDMERIAGLPVAKATPIAAVAVEDTEAKVLLAKNLPLGKHDGADISSRSGSRGSSRRGRVVEAQERQSGDTEENRPRDNKARAAAAATGKKSKPGSAAAALEAAAAAATLARWPHPSPRDHKKILRRGELARCFGDRHGFEVLEDTVDRLPDGRPVACFLARRMPLVVSSPSNASSNASFWRDDPPTRHTRRQQLQQRGSGIQSSQDPPVSSFGPGPAASFRWKPLPSSLDTINNIDSDNHSNNATDGVDDDDSTGENSSRDSSPAKGFPINSSPVLLDDSDGDEEDDGGGDDLGASGRAAMWGGFSGVGSGSRRDFTETRAASIRRRTVAAEW